MDTDRFLTLLQWLSPSFPTGGFAWSHGLEQAIRDGAVKGRDSLADWLADLLAHGAGRTDAVLIGAAHRGGADGYADLAATALALSPSAERRAEALGQGAAFAATVRAVWGHDLPDAVLPVVIGRAAALEGLPAVPVAQAHLLAFATALTQAAQRLMALGQTDAQRVIHGLRPLAGQVATDACGLPLDAIGGATFAIDIAALRHETLEPRLFRS